MCFVNFLWKRFTLRLESGKYGAKLRKHLTDAPKEGRELLENDDFSSVSLTPTVPK
jgi:hypothetical protein